MSAAAQDSDALGEKVYQQHCAVCHDQTNTRIPSQDQLRTLPAARILHTLDFGVMMSIAYPLKRTEREAVAKYLGTANASDETPPSAFCQERGAGFSNHALANWNGWSPDASNSRFQTTTASRLTPEQVARLKVKWAFGFPGDVIAFAAPTVFRGSLFAGGASGHVQALNATTGCTQWTFQADGPVRMAVVVAQLGSNYVALFGDQLGSFYALDARTGRLLWRRRIDEHEATRLTASPAILNDTVFVGAASWEETRALDPHYPCCTFRGSVSALLISDGTPIWKSYLVEPPAKRGVNAAETPSFGPSGVSVWAAPTVDKKRKLLYVTTGDNYSLPASAMSDSVVALDARTGRIVWSQQFTHGDAYNSSCPGGANCPSSPGPDHDFGASAILVNFHGRGILLAGQKAGIVYALDPDHGGTMLWKTRVGRGSALGGIEWGMASDGERLYAAVSDVVPMGASLVGPRALGSSTFDPARGGGLTALKLDDGARAWFAPAQPCEPPRPGCSPGQPAALSAIPGVVFSGSMDGHLRAFASMDGHTIWDFDAVREYSTVNGVAARGGSLDGAGPVVVDGMVYVTSGSSRFGGMPGNVLIAFGAN